MAVYRMTRELTLEDAVETQDGFGGFTTTWVALGKIWADVRPGTGRESDREAVPFADVPYRIVVRGTPVDAPSRPRPGQRFREGSRVFDIVAVSEADALGQYLTCFAKEEGAT